MDKMLKNKQAVIFDLDGTLVDSMWLWKQIDIDYLMRFNIPLPDGLQQDIEGMSFSETAVYFKEHFQIPDSLDKIKADWNEMAMDFYKHRVFLKNGALDFLKYLKKSGIKTGIATSNSRELLNAVLDALNIHHYFDSVHVACDVSKGKPAPDIYLLVAAELGIKPENCLVFEDISQGVMAGKSAGMQVCGVFDEYAKKRHDNVKELADYYINDYIDILKKDANK
jgi:16S rRNA pseudouridine516 synthase